GSNTPALAPTAPDPAIVADVPVSGATDALPDVIVTARRRAEDAARVPAALTVVGGDTIDRSYTVNTQQLSILVPTLNY
ncbi:hypothetical protein ABTE26_21150, partial [Acinetobacter baumannii]